MLSEKIRELRIVRGLSQVELASILNVSKQSVSNWENDNIQPSVDMLIHLAETFDVSTDYLLGRETQRFLSTKGLSKIELEHIQNIINDIRNKK